MVYCSKQTVPLTIYKQNYIFSLLILNCEYNFYPPSLLIFSRVIILWYCVFTTPPPSPKHLLILEIQALYWENSKVQKLKINGKKKINIYLAHTHTHPNTPSLSRNHKSHKYIHPSNHSHYTLQIVHYKNLNISSIIKLQFWLQNCK